MVCFLGDSSNINEIIKAALNSLLLFFFFYKKILHTYWQNIRYKDKK